MRQAALELIIDPTPAGEGRGLNGKHLEQDLDVPAQEEVDQLCCCGPTLQSTLNF